MTMTGPTLQVDQLLYALKYIYYLLIILYLIWIFLICQLEEWRAMFLDKQTHVYLYVCIMSLFKH